MTSTAQMADTTVVYGVINSLQGIGDTTVTAPCHQFDMVKDIVKSTKSANRANIALAREYHAIGLAIEKATRSTINTACCRNTPAQIREILKTGGSLYELPTDRDAAQRYPRDFVSWIDNRLLLAPYDACLSEAHHSIVIQSPFSEGGRLLCRQNKAFIGEPRDYEIPHVGVLLQHRLRVFSVPSPLLAYQTEEHEEKKYAPDTHLDRVYSLVEAGDGTLHLIVESNMVGDVDREAPDAPSETIPRLKTICRAAGVTLQVLPPYRNPSAACLWQSQSGRIVVTGDEPELHHLLRELVGKKNVFPTRVPIRQYPVWFLAGIRCLVGEMPPWILSETA